MLKAFSVPITPQGKSALATLPPWHYSSDCIAIEYWADPAAIAALLPLSLQPDEKSGGRAFFWFPSQAMEMGQIMPDVAAP